MWVIDLATAAGVMVVVVAIGTAVHELAHASVLCAFGIEFDVEVNPCSGATGLVNTGLYGAWAAVTPRGVPVDTSPVGVRLAAIAPLGMAVPGLLILAGVIPDPVQRGDLVVTAALMAWFGCAIPSPQDFGVFWHAEKTIPDLDDTCIDTHPY